jgi:hypothetical protein
LLQKIDLAGQVPHRRRWYRGIQVLERIGSEEARRQLKTLACGDPQADVTREAKAALGRLGPVR